MDLYPDHRLTLDELNKAGRSQIQQEWIIRTLNSPDYPDRDKRTDTIRVWKRIR